MNVTVMIKNGGYEVVDIPCDLIGGLANKIKEEGSAALYKANGTTVVVVGFMVTGKQTGERLIVLDKSKEDE